MLQSLDGGGQGGSGNAQADVHPPGLAVHRRAMDAEGRELPQTQAHQQHQRQARICKYCTYSTDHYKPTESNRRTLTFRNSFIHQTVNSKSHLPITT